jgi:hypothetical protein
MEPELVPLQGFWERYGITKSTMYDRLSKVGIKPTPRGRHSYITTSEQDRMDRLDAYLKEGGTCETFEPTVKMEAGAIEIASKQEAYADMLMLIEAISRHFNRQSVDPLANQKALIFAAENRLILPSSQISQLIGKKLLGVVCVWGSFKIERVGKVGRESGWLVSQNNFTANPETKY